MKTPAGKECKFFYGDYYRGRNHEECRLLLDHGLEWSSYLCEQCPIPDIVLANSCQYMKFHPQLKRPFIFMRPQVKVTAYCEKANSVVAEPKVGCSECHPGLENIVFIAPDQED